MTRFFLGFCAAALVATPALALQGPPKFRTETIPAPAQPGAVPLYPDGTLPRSKVTERWNRTIGQIGPITIDQRSVRNVTRPTITPVLPDPAKATGAAVIVAPGGAFLSLSMDNEGWNVARRLADAGVAAFVLKYRLNETPEDDAAYMARMAEVFASAGRGDVSRTVSEPRATADALQALRVVRAGAKRWSIDPARVGMIGFSAGAMTALQAVTTGKPAERPAFFGYIYGPMGPVAVPADAPPMFAAIALDDGLFGRQGFGIVESWHQAKRPVELHAYERGDHGFGLGRQGTTTMLMMDQFLAWLDSRGLLKRETER
jgi:acetyl esterase/lipase